MVGCCGQKNQSSNQRGACGPVNSRGGGGNPCAPDLGGGQKRPGPHNEEICHGTGERRRDLLDQLKIFLNDFDDKPCKGAPPDPNIKSLGSYPEYHKKHCMSYMPPNPRPPLITSVQTHEIRATSDYKKMQAETSEYISFTDASQKPPVMTCECVKRNGLQDQCSHPMCKPPTAQCLANNPGPCCPPSMGLAGPEAVLGSKDKGPASPKQVCSDESQGPGRSEYQEAYHHQQQQQFAAPRQSFTTTYQQDYVGHQQHMGGQHMGGQHMGGQHMGGQHMGGQHMGGGHHQFGGGGQQHHGGPAAPAGMELMCVCEVPSSALPSGKKYLCCPLPPQ